MLIFHYTCSKSHLRQASRGVPSRGASKINNKYLFFLFVFFLYFYLKTQIFRLGSSGSTFGGSQGGAIIISGGQTCQHFITHRAKRRSGRVKILIFHYTCSKSHLRRVNMSIFHYTQSKKRFREGENVDISLYVQ